MDLPRPFYVLAPMDDVTDTVLRQIIGSCASPDLYFTEFVNVDGLQSPGRLKLLKKLRFTESEQPLIVQLWGKTPDNFRKTSAEIADGTFARELGLRNGINFAGVDLNMGCPEKNVVKNGTCSALINDRDAAAAIIDATKVGLGGALPLSIKTRIGFNTIDLSWIEFVLQHDIAMLSVHLRTRREMSKVPAHWEIASRIRELRDKIAPSTILVGNGDVMSRQHGEALAKESGFDGIMIGRGIFDDPFVFAAQSPWQTMAPAKRIALYRQHVELFEKTWRNNEHPIQTLNKFCKMYVQGFDGAKDLRESLMRSISMHELQEKLTAMQTAVS